MQMAQAKSLLVLGGTSDIGRATAAVYAAVGWSVTLAVRNAEEGGRDAQDLTVRTRARKPRRRLAGRSERRREQ